METTIILNSLIVYCNNQKKLQPLLDHSILDNTIAFLEDLVVKQKIKSMRPARLHLDNSNSPMPSYGYPYTDT
jgi:hypothetical protein